MLLAQSANNAIDPARAHDLLTPPQLPGRGP